MTDQDLPKDQESTDEESSGESRVRLKKLNINRETIQELNDEETTRVQGGRMSQGDDSSGPVPITGDPIASPQHG